MTKINMKRTPLFTSIKQMEDYLKTSQKSGLKVKIISKKDKYEFINQTLWDGRYRSRSKKEKHVILKYLKFFTDYSKGHLKKLANKWRNGTLKYNLNRNRHKFGRKYFSTDIALLIETDKNHGCLSGKATKSILEREFKIFKKTDPISPIYPLDIFTISEITAINISRQTRCISKRLKVLRLILGQEKSQSQMANRAMSG
ncbi:MAG: hypothetical protein U9Q85_04235 [Patescibacteria group bacterium]|nr:hypothetical protein [Patescibacteria group bacterium]